jgi:RES domain-containing protein
MLEMLARLGRVAVPPNYHYIEIDIPDDLIRNDLIREELIVPPQDLANESVTRQLGNEWYDSQRSPILLVPSVITQVDRNILIHPRHPEFTRITPSNPRPVHWDPRLFL